LFFCGHEVGASRAKNNFLKTGRYKNQETTAQIASGELRVTTAPSHERLG